MSSWLEQGSDVVWAWAVLSSHGHKCDQCGPAVVVLRDDAHARFEPQWLLMCDEGRTLAEAWTAAHGALVERWKSDRRRTLAQEK